MTLSLVKGAALSEENGQGAHTIPGYLEDVCRRFGDAEAVVTCGSLGRVSWSYRQLYEEARSVARALIALGLKPKDRVGILMANRAEYVSSIFGVSMAGGVVVALNTFSTLAELQHQVAVSELSIILFDRKVAKQDFAAMLAQIDRPKTLQHMVVLPSATDHADLSDPSSDSKYESWDTFLTRAQRVSAEEVSSRIKGVRSHDVGGIFFSSGTTSLPKGIVHSQQAFAIQWWRWPRIFAMDKPVRSWTGNGLFWSGNVSMALGAAFSTGGAVILQPMFHAGDALSAIEQEKVTFLAGRPHQWARVQAEPAWQTADLSSLHYVTKGDLITEHPTVNTDWVTPNAFGTTETMTICTSFDANTSSEQYQGSVGVPLPGNTLKIIDPKTGAVVPQGARGEMCIKGPTLMLGYLGKEPEACFDEDGFYHTGDGGYVDEVGRFFWEGRLTDLIKSGGVNVSPEEVDIAIAAFLGIKRTQTVGVVDTLLGERVVSCIVPLEGEVIDLAALQVFLRHRLAAFKCPRNVLVFEDADFALTANEKPMAGQIKKVAEEKLQANL